MELSIKVGVARNIVKFIPSPISRGHATPLAPCTYQWAKSTSMIIDAEITVLAIQSHEGRAITVVIEEPLHCIFV